VKELAHCETDSRKIEHLKSMLSDLGMTGRMTMDRAKAIREKRELEQEIGEPFPTQDTGLFVAIAHGGHP
jgi:hypothetical protein